MRDATRLLTHAELGHIQALTGPTKEEGLPSQINVRHCWTLPVAHPGATKARCSAGWRLSGQGARERRSRARESVREERGSGELSMVDTRGTVLSLVQTHALLAAHRAVPRPAKHRRDRPVSSAGRSPLTPQQHVEADLPAYPWGGQSGRWTVWFAGEGW